MFGNLNYSALIQKAQKTSNVPAITEDQLAMLVYHGMSTYAGRELVSNLNQNAHALTNHAFKREAPFKVGDVVYLVDPGKLTSFYSDAFQRDGFTSGRSYTVIDVTERSYVTDEAHRWGVTIRDASHRHGQVTWDACRFTLTRPDPKPYAIQSALKGKSPVKDSKEWRELGRAGIKVYLKEGSNIARFLFVNGKGGELKPQYEYLNQGNGRVGGLPTQGLLGSEFANGPRGQHCFDPQDFVPERKLPTPQFKQGDILRCIDEGFTYRKGDIMRALGDGYLTAEGEPIVRVMNLTEGRHMAATALYEKRFVKV